MKALAIALLAGILSCGQSRPVAPKTAERPSALLETVAPIKAERIITGAERISEYLPLLKGKRVAIVANQTSLIGNTHLVDTLLASGIDVVKVFALEHGFRGTAAEGEHIASDTDPRTGVPIVSLYGKHFKPTPADLVNVDVVLFDIQDVGVRFYTYVSSMHYIMEACAETGHTFILLDRPNPNGHYIDGPILDTAYRSFVGMHPIPIVHGCTLGEMARMIQGQGWIHEASELKFQVIACQNYTHATPYDLPVKPSPNLPNALAIAMYPSLCLFEGTAISVGRGTPYPFQQWGSPYTAASSDTFTPTAPANAPIKPVYNGQQCYGYRIRKMLAPRPSEAPAIDWTHLLQAYNSFEPRGKKVAFFNAFFTKLAGGPMLQSLIEQGASPAKIREAYAPDLEKYKTMRAKYLLYP